jgi:Alpha amylase, C-terminal all-beta domain
LHFTDNQRGHGAGGSTILTYKSKDLYTKAVVFMLSHPHGGNHPRVMSSFYFDDASQGPPQDADGNIVSRGVDENGQCTNGWVCEHRWAPIANMIKFRAVTDGTVVRAFTNIGQNQISFCRGNKGFVAINNAGRALKATVNACVPDGYYCDVVSGNLVNGKCTGKIVTVKDGKASVELDTDSAGVLAIHVGAKTTGCTCAQSVQVNQAPVALEPSELSGVRAKRQASEEESESDSDVSLDSDSDEESSEDSEDSPESLSEEDEPEELESVEPDEDAEEPEADEDA